MTDARMVWNEYQLWMKPDPWQSKLISDRNEAYDIQSFFKDQGCKCEIWQMQDSQHYFLRVAFDKCFDDGWVLVEA